MNETQKKLTFPQEETELERIATSLELPLENDVFDDVIRYYYVYLIMTVEGESDFITERPVSCIHYPFIVRSSLEQLPGKTHLVHYTRRDEDLSVRYKRVRDDG